ncbi:MAG: hypothetical protein M3Z16_09625 [Pseudomonadota bacterium]|nr:hypothetical protein [Pseudomonadota bacterium]
MTARSFAARLTAAAGVAVTNLALVGAAGAAGSTLFAISTLVASNDAQRITLVARAGSTGSMPTRTTAVALAHVVAGPART